MLRTLSKTLTGATLALTLALTGLSASATPAAANGHRNNQGAEAAAIFGGLLLLYGLSQAGRNNGNVTRNQLGAPVQVVPHQPRPHVNHRVAPAQCYVEGNSYGQFYRGYRARCMQQNVSAPHLLPQHCLRDVWTDRGQRQIYGGRCLADAGWTRGY